MPGRSFAQTTDFEGKIITDIKYDDFPAPLAPKDLERVQKLKKGTAYHATDVATTIDSMYATDRFEDIQVDVTPEGDNGVVVRFITKQNWFVGHIEMSGKISAPPNRGQLTNSTQLNLGVKYHDQDLAAAETNLKKLLQDNGLYEATVKTSVARDPKTQTVNFAVVVRSGKRAKYTTPEITAQNQGDLKLTDNTIIRATGWRIPLIHWWRQVTQEKTRTGVEGIQKKYASKDRLTAKVNLDSLDYDAKTRRVRPALTIDPGPKVDVKAVEAKVSKGRLKKYVPIYEEGTVDNDLLVEGARNLRDYFQSQGYYDAQVDWRRLPLKNDQLTIEYVIARGTRYKLSSVSIKGNKYFGESSLRERMFLTPASLFDRHGRYSEAFRKKDEEAIGNLYKANGFQSVNVTSTVLNPYKGKQGDIAVIYAVDEGPQSFVDSLKIEGVQRIAEPPLVSKLSSAAGQPYSLVNIADDRNQVLTAYYTNGFPAATFQYQVQPADAPNHVNLIYTVNEGGQQFVRGVLVTGRHTTRQSLIDKHLPIHAGDELAPTKISEVQRGLYNLGVFAKVNATAQDPEGDTAYKLVQYDFEEANRYVVNVGIGAEIAQFGGTTQDLSSPGGATGFSPRGSLDISRLNFLGLGHTVTFRSRVSDLEQMASIEYLAPRFMGVETRQLTFTVLYDNARDVRTFASKREEASVQLSQQLSKSLTAYVRFAYRRVSTSDIVIPTLLVPQLLQPIRIGIASFSVIQDRRDDPTDAHKGIYNTADVGLASNIFGSQRNFARVLFKNATYTKIGKNMVFARQTQVGMIVPYNAPAGISDAESVPLPERFFGGGANSHRGFPYNQAGPRDIGMPAAAGGVETQPTGFPLGGNALLFNTFELRFPLIGSNIGGVLFHDAGNVYRSVSDITLRSSQRNLQDFNYMVHAVGFGIRYRTPVGPVRVDLAYSINPPSYLGFRGTVLDLLACNPNLPPSQLPSVCQPVQQSVSHFQFSFSIGQAF